MKAIAAFFRLVRWPNLLFIVLTQLLFYFCVYVPLFNPAQPPLRLAWIVTASVLIAAAGYIINDYFDLDIDQVNKPEKNVINRLITRRWAIFWHAALSLAGIVATVLAVGWHKSYLIGANVVVVLLLWLYSTSLKKKMLIGNVVISALTAWTVLILFFAQVPFRYAFGAQDAVTTKFFRVAFLYAGFAFVLSLIREAIKDVEDLEGDRRYGCRTMPIVTGVVATKVYTTVWIVVLLGALILLQLYILQFRWWWAVIYSVFLVIFPLISLFFSHLKASSTAEFATLSRLSKWIMLAGIGSMLFFRLYF
ncbi:ubiquinone biosynthesis protein UbiA [Flaviaesturariibacter flavus]|uniref:Ubiquinone biosynthesis protein UbiA n=1 Tax=Flaviaesturariibacter flavus TaxID=2502780 RepID=A0A4R1BNI7_9BACT|nr:geranylgeranylglycerol-phosphate geranylgeranyltransferase [Flaviaesturariibacter flavus]TCJ19180.1 ubiquinone biosynthesis protein UbiA [Flaviaesturariibacter flavus]